MNATESVSSDVEFEAEQSAAQPTKPVAPNLRAKLEVLTGLQTGAVAWLVSGAPMKLGSSLDDDVILRHASVAPTHASVSLHKGILTFDCLAGTAIAQGKTLRAGESINLTENCQIQLGEIVIALHSSAEEVPPHFVVGENSSAGEKQAQPLIDIAGAGDATDPLQAAFSMPSIDDLPALADSQQSDISTKQSASEPQSRTFTVVLIAAFAIGAAVFWQTIMNKQPAAEPVALHSAIAASPFATLVVEQTGEHATVSGFLDSIEESQGLTQLLDQTGLQITNDVVVGESLALRITDIFRVSGVSAEVQIEHGGHATADTQESDLELLASIDTRIQTDVPGVASLTINNDPPRVASDKPVDSDPGKRVAMVVYDEPAHIVTEDQSRYFVGSILPTGYRIASFENGKVFVERDGLLTELKF